MASTRCCWILEKHRRATPDSKNIELGFTIAGEPFYIARGYREFECYRHAGANGADKVVIRMAKKLR